MMGLSMCLVVVDVCVCCVVVVYANIVVCNVYAIVT